MSNSTPTGSQLTSERDRRFAVGLMEHLVVAIFVIDTDCRVVVWNKACERLTGIRADDIIGTREHWRAFYSKRRPCLADLVITGRVGDVHGLYKNGRMNEVGGLEISAENWCAMPRLGRNLYLALDAGPIHDEFGNLIAAVESLRDMTVQKQAQTELESLATRDWLTGLANRRRFDEMLAVETRKAARGGLPVSLLMVDIDFFKPYNDTYGHQEGDTCLKAVAAAISRALRCANDFAARYGGEEFAIILPNTALSDAALMAEKIRKAVDDLRIPHQASTACDHVTISIGGATADVSGLAPGTLVACADAALYQAKRDGRNRTSITQTAARLAPAA